MVAFRRDPEPNTSGPNHSWDFLKSSQLRLLFLPDSPKPEMKSCVGVFHIILRFADIQHLVPDALDPDMRVLLQNPPPICGVA